MGRNIDSWKRLADEADAAGVGDPSLYLPPDYDPDPIKDESWMPALGTTQLKVFNDASPVLLVYGEKGSGKSISLLECDVRHAYENDDALVLVLVTFISAGAEGVWHDLENFTLPRWRDGNKFPDWLNGKPHPRAGEYMDQGIGLHFEPTKLDPVTKDRHIWVSTANGGWSKILLKSIPHASQVDGRIRGPAPSRVHVEEITLCDGSEYYVLPTMQLKRRRGIKAPMQFTASCNPDGPSHWVHKEIIAKSEDENGVKDPQYAIYHIPLTDNAAHINPDYAEHLKKVISDPYMRRRMIDGEWVDVPSGDAIFKDYFVPEIHVKGDVLKGIGLIPLKGFPIQVGHDPGPKNYSIHFEQLIPTSDPDRPFVWSIFDELNFVGLYKPYDLVAKIMVRRIQYWINHPQVGFNYVFQHIADEAAFTQKNSKGTFDALDMQREAKRFGYALKMTACPKGNDTQPQRVQMLINLLLHEQAYVSARCEKTIDMLRLIPSKKLKDGEYDPYVGMRPQKCPHLHPLDSMTYPMWKNQVRPFQMPKVGDVSRPSVFVAGSG